MTLNEFKAWLDGFSEAMGEAPTPEQWAKIKHKLGEVEAWPVQVAPGLYQTRPGSHPGSAVVTVPLDTKWISTNSMEQ